MTQTEIEEIYDEIKYHLEEGHTIRWCWKNFGYLKCVTLYRIKAIKKQIKSETK